MGFHVAEAAEEYLYVLNKDWFHTLLFETAGKATLGICGAVILVTYLFMLKFTKPIEYKG